ncbi:MAG: hypothetical protein O7H39_17815 [Gammaproteobacteria bacterium]|nr:hypothetical protein [Gammaproteobacteria bacterium]
MIIEVKMRFNALSLRERVLVLAAAVASLWVVWDFAFSHWVPDVMAAKQREVNLLNHNITDEVAAQDALRSRFGSDTLIGMTGRRDNLRQRIDVIETRHTALLGEFVDPEMTPALLKDVLDRHEGLKLVKLTSLPAEVMTVTRDNEVEVIEGIYRHPLELTFTGRYFDVLAYLTALEELEWDFVWRSFDYRVGEYPLADITLEVETIGREEDWLGV